MARFSITYSTLTDDSVSNGDHADNGWIDDQDQLRHTLNDADREITIEASRQGVCDWGSLRHALAFMSEKCTHIETCWFPDGSHYNRTMTLYGTGNTDDCEGDEIEVCYDLHIEGMSLGSMVRLARLLQNNGVYFANWRHPPTPSRPVTTHRPSKVVHLGYVNKNDLLK